MGSLIGPAALYAAVIYAALRFIPSIRAGQGTALIVAVVMGFVNAGLGFGLRYMIDSLLVFFVMGFLVRIFINVLLLYGFGSLFTDLNLRALTAAVMVAAAVTVTALIYDSLRQDTYRTDDQAQPYFVPEESGRSGGN